MRNGQRLSIVLAILLIASIPQNSLAVNIAVTGTLGDLDGNGDGGAGEAAVVQAVAGCWSARVTTDRPFVLTVQGGSLSGGGIGQGAMTTVDFALRPNAGTLTMDNDGSTTFYVDPTPLDSSEFPTDDAASPWRLEDGPAIDLFSTVLHETGHTLAWVCGDTSCGFPNPFYDLLLNPPPGSFVASATCVSPFPVRGQPALAGCVHLQAPGYDVSLRGDGLGDAVNDLSHPGIIGDLMLGFYSDRARETMSVEDVRLFQVAYGDSINQPPMVDAGPDVLSECNATGGSNVSLNGAGSTDPENNVLTYSWGCPAVALSAAGTATPGGFFPLDSDTLCRLDLTDVAACPPDADFVRVQVVDTTDPVVSCPVDVIAECTGNNGVEATDAQLTPFLTGAMVSDVCDDTLTIDDSAPGFFPLGDTTVTFSSTDDSLNTGDCDATVTVEDTLDPTIEVTLDRTKLWPANHKLATINALVVVDDVCDPSPTFVLTSITSNEPDNGLGDGDEPFDIQGADVATPDTEFQLRSERSGLGSGRVYEIVYTVTDGSGNDTQTSKQVVVPHDQSGGAKAGLGFTLTGMQLNQNARTFDLIVPSSPWFDARRVVVQTTQVGNTAGVLNALRSRLRDTNFDGLTDLVVTYSTADAVDLAAISGSDDPLAFRYETARGVGYLVENIFSLGHPAHYPE